MQDLWRRPLDEYKSLVVRSAAGVHSAAADMVLCHAGPSASVLGVAAGTGAWLAKLRDAGFINLSAIELNAEAFQLDGITPVCVDLNTDFAKSFDRRFDVITAIEIIEHLENPRHFVRQLRSLLNDDGFLLLTTPNIAHWKGRLRFLLTGEMRYFREAEYHGQRHISPISDLHMKLLLREVGFQVSMSRTAGDFSGSLNIVVTAPVWGIMRLALGELVRGDVAIYLARKADADTSSAGHSSSSSGNPNRGATQGMRILHLIDSSGFYGAEAMVVQLACEQKAAGHVPILGSMGTLGCGEKPVERVARHKGVCVLPFRLLPGPDFTASIRMLLAVKHHGVDILHCHGYKPDILIGVVPRWLRRIPIVATLHGYTHTGGFNRLATYSWLDQRALKKFDRVVLVHREIAKRLRAYNPDDERYCVVENGISPLGLDEQTSVPDNGVLNFCRRHPVIGSVGRLAREKGYVDLIEAVRLLKLRNLDVSLVVLGDGDERVALERHIDVCGLRERVLLPGFVSQPRAYLPLFDVFVLPSLTEGLPMALLEAMEAGTPIIATRVGGVPDLLDQGQCGVLVEPGGPEELAEQIEKLLADQSFALDLGRRAHDRVEQRFSSAATTSRYISLYRELTCSDTRR